MVNHRTRVLELRERDLKLQGEAMEAKQKADQAESDWNAATETFRAIATDHRANSIALIEAEKELCSEVLAH